MGISFYTFQALRYVLAVYQGRSGRNGTCSAARCSSRFSRSWWRGRLNARKTCWGRCAVSVSGNGGAAYGPLLEALGIPAGEAGMWLVSAGSVLWSSGLSGMKYFELDGHDLKLTAGPEGNGMVFDRETIQTPADGVSVFVYDAVTQARAAYLAFDAAGP